MSLDIHLTPSAIAGLYNQPLIPHKKEVPVEPVALHKAESPVDVEQGYKYLGKNRQRIVLIVHFPEDVFLPEDQLSFIIKMLGACHLNLADVAIINSATAAVGIGQLKQQLEPATIILFGVESVSIGLPISFPHFKDQEYAGCNYLFTPPPSELNQETDQGKLLKSKLWLCLKKMFKVNPK